MTTITREQIQAPHDSAGERAMQVGDRVRWVPTGQEGRVMELRDGGIISVFGEDGSGNWAVYDYADRFELVNECRVKPADRPGPRVRSRPRTRQCR